PYEVFTPRVMMKTTCGDRCFLIDYLCLIFVSSSYQYVGASRLRFAQPDQYKLHGVQEYLSNPCPLCSSEFHHKLFTCE
ncbi:hypothetical protein ACFL6N_06295, partial [Thermodesulfobacteriota bacterium]